MKRNFELFKCFQEYAEFQATIIDGSIEITRSKGYICPCTKDPTLESCVDPLTSGLQHHMVAVNEGMSNLAEKDKATLALLPQYNDLMSAFRWGEGVVEIG